MQYPPHKCLPEKLCLHCLRILIMSWMFKDPVVIMKVIIEDFFKWMNFFSLKTTHRIFMYLLARFILQTFLEILRVDPELRGCAIFGTKMAYLSWTKFFWYNPLSLLSSTFWTFSLCKIQKNTYRGSRVIRMHHFWAENGPFSPNKFFWKIFNIILINLLAPFIV